jgi:hypothetical protein
MDQEIKDKWIKALRSGEYKQHRGASNDRIGTVGAIPAERCCLNVGAHALIGAEANKLLTYQCSDLLGLDSDQEFQLVDMNDSREYTFEQIADWIETNIGVTA